MQMLHVDPFGGLAGDMFLAALLDLGRPEFQLADLESFLAATLPGEVTLELHDVVRRGIGGKHLVVRPSNNPPMRHPGDLQAVIERSPLGSAARARAVDAIEGIALVEAEIHRIPRERVHFHEIGAVDTIVDVAGAAFALERLGIEAFEHAPPYVGGGIVETEHGPLPVPAPATAALMVGRAWLAGPGGERLTPTGAALLAAFGRPVAAASFVPEAIGYGAGTRDKPDGPANLVRVLLGTGVAAHGASPSATETIDELRFQLDDATGEQIGFLLEGLVEAGALDAWTVALGMKKGRPGVGVVALARPEGRAALERVAFDRSPTLGLRWLRTERVVCAREVLSVSVGGRNLRVKRRLVPHRTADEPRVSAWDLSPEYEDLAAWARETGRPLVELEAEAVAAARASLGG